MRNTLKKSFATVIAIASIMASVSVMSTNATEDGSFDDSKVIIRTTGYQPFGDGAMAGIDRTSTFGYLSTRGRYSTSPGSLLLKQASYITIDEASGITHAGVNLISHTYYGTSISYVKGYHTADGYDTETSR